MNKQNETVLRVMLWAAQATLAAMFLFAFYAKLVQPVEETVQMMPWVGEQTALATFTGLMDLLAGLGLILPVLLNVQPKLTVYAAYGGMALMIGGIVFHLSRGEASVIGLNVALIPLLGFVAWGRAENSAASIQPQGVGG